jgi:hypothetical protein
MAAAAKVVGGKLDGANTEKVQTLKEIVKVMVVPPVDKKRLYVTVRNREGSSALVHRFHEDVKGKMLKKQMGGVVEKNGPRDPQKEYEQSLYPKSEKGKHQFPTSWFKGTMTNAAHTFDTVKRAQAKGACFVVGEFVEVEGEPNMHEATVRLETGVAMQRFRAEFKKWSARLTIEFNPKVISEEKIIHLLDAAGFSVGVGDHRPQKNGTNGRFEVDYENVQVGPA